MQLQMIDKIPQERQNTVTGYIRLFVDLSIPSGVVRVCILYYGTHCPCTDCWSVDDIQDEKQTISDLAKLVHGCFSINIALQFESTRQFRILLSQANNPPIREVIDSEVVPRFLEFCGNKKAPELQYESMWALVNISSGPAECAAYIIKIDGHIVLIDLLESPLYEIKEQILWTLGNIAGDGNELKDLLLTSNILNNILPICKSEFNKKCVTNFNKSKVIIDNPMFQYVNLLSTCSWTVSNLCRTVPPNIAYLADLIECLRCLLQKSLSMSSDYNIGGPVQHQYDIGKKNEIIQNIAWGFSYLTGFDTFGEEIISKMYELGIIKQFIDLLNHEIGQLRHPINRLIGNILTGSDEYVGKCLDFGILYKYKYILTKTNNISNREQREICWSLSLICATDCDKDKLRLMKHGLLKILINYLNNTCYETAKEALWAISNATTKCNAKIINHLVKNGIQNELMAFLRKYERTFIKSKKNKILLVALECIENILTVGQFSYLFKECGIVAFLENLQDDEENINDQVYAKCVEIMKKYFLGEEEVNPNTNNQNDNNNNNNNGNNNFSFGINSNNNGGSFDF